MSYPSLRNFVLTLTLALVPLLPATPAHAATSPSSHPALSAATITAIRDSGPPVMQQAAAAEATAPLNYTRTAALPKAMPLAVSNPRLFREVMGFAFASSLGDPTIGYPSWNMSLLSTVAYFGVHVDWTGALSNDSGLAIWNDPNGPVPAFIAAAHSAGTKVVLTIEMFDSTPGTRNMCSALQRANLTIQQTVAQVNAKGVDGVNVDYESDNTQCTDGNGVVQWSQSLFTSFVGNLRGALPAGSYLSVDTYSGAAGYRSGATYYGFFDIGALNNYVDSFMVMAYDMEYDNGLNPPMNCSTYCLGPTSPLSYYYWNQGRASAEYTAVVPASKVIMGMPYYGRKECVAGYAPSNAPPNALRAPGTGWVAEGYLDASTENGYSLNSDYHTHREVHDTQGNTEWDTFTSSQASCTRELYWDDTVALGNKYDLVINNHLRGIGIFALNYGGGAPELWNLIQVKFGQCSQAAIAPDHATPQIPGTSVTFTASALCAGTGTYRFWLSPPTGGWTMKQDYSTTNTWTWSTTGLALGTYRIEVDARNLGSNVPYDTVATYSFRLALCGPATINSDLGSPRLPGTTVTFTSTVTCTGTPEYRFWVLPPGGIWAVAQDYGPSPTFKWDTTHLAYGDYRISVHARNSGTTVAYESYESMPYSLRSCISTALTTDKAAPQPTGSQITLNASATCDGPAQYQFVIQPPGGSPSVVQGFLANSAFAWNAGGPGGAYTLEVDAKSATAPAAAASSAQLGYNLTSCTGAALSANPVSPQEPGATIALTASATCQGTPQYRFSTQQPGAAPAVVQKYSSTATYSWNTGGLPYGVYTLTVDVRNTGGTSDAETTASLNYSLQAAACTAPTDTAGLVQGPGNTAFVNISATTTACPHPVYQFWIQAPGSTTWAIAQAYSTSASYHWTAPGNAAGTYNFSVWVRDASRPGVQITTLGDLDAYANVAYSYAPCTAASIAMTPPGSTLSGGTVTVTGGATGCSNPQYEFWTRASNSSSWTIAQPFSANATFNWSTAGPLPIGTYYLSVWARDATSPGADVSSLGSFDAWASSAYTLTTVPCTGASLSTTPPASSPGGTTIAVSASAAGCPSPLYEFWLLAPGSTWRIAQAYSPSASYSWTTLDLPPGVYRISVWVRDASSLAGYDAYAPGAAYTLTTTPCGGVTASTSPTSPQAAGNTVTITATASGCPHPRYEFWIMMPGGSWTIVQTYSSSASFTWTTSPPAGTYRYSVWVRDGSSMAAYDAYLPGAAYTLTTTPCTAVSASAAPAAPQAAGTPITITASASGCANPRYEFWILAPGGSWTIAQGYSPSATFTWNTSGLPAGSYRFSVWVRDASSAGVYDAYYPGTSYTLT